MPHPAERVARLHFDQVLAIVHRNHDEVPHRRLIFSVSLELFEVDDRISNEADG
jgi:hypothetical protein